MRLGILLDQILGTSTTSGLQQAWCITATDHTEILLRARAQHAYAHGEDLWHGAGARLLTTKPGARLTVHGRLHRGAHWALDIDGAFPSTSARSALCVLTGTTSTTGADSGETTVQEWVRAGFTLDDGSSVPLDIDVRPGDLSRSGRWTGAVHLGQHLAQIVPARPYTPHTPTGQPTATAHGSGEEPL